MKHRLFSFLPVIIVLLFSFLAGFSLLHPGLPPTHDGEYHILRFYEFDKVLRDGNLYPRWAPDFNNGYGVPLFNYVYPLPNYTASFLHFFGFSFIDSFKFQMFIAIIIGGIFFYLFSKQFWGNLGGIVCSIFYTFSPYHFVDIYVRGSAGEVWALALFPAFLWSITIFIKEKKRIYIPLSSLFLALVIFSHNILGLMFFLFALFYITLLIVQSNEKKFLIQNILQIVLIGLGLSSIFWLPALLENKYVIGLQIYNIKDNFPEIYQLIFPSWGTGFSSNDPANQLSFQIGIANLIAVFLSFFVLLKFFLKKDSRKYSLLFFIIFFFLVFFLLLEKSFFIWQAIPLMNYFQFPWRFLSLEILIASFLAGSIVALYKSKIIVFLLVIFAVVLTFGYTKPAYYHQRNDNYYLTRSNFIDGTNSVGNYFNTVWFDNNLKKKKNKLELEKDKIISQEISSQNYKFNLSSNKERSVILDTAYFPGWTVYVNGEKEKILNTSDGRIMFNVPKGSSSINIKFLNTPQRRVSMIVSLGSFLFCIFFLVKSLKR